MLYANTFVCFLIKDYIFSFLYNLKIKLFNNLTVYLHFYYLKSEHTHSDNQDVQEYIKNEEI